MQNKDTTPATAQTSTQHPARERVGLAIYGTDSAETLSAIAAAEAAGVRQVWMTQSTPAPDTLTIFAAAAMRTTSTRLGTASYPPIRAIPWPWRSRRWHWATFPPVDCDWG